MNGRDINYIKSLLSFGTGTCQCGSTQLFSHRKVRSHPTCQEAEPQAYRFSSQVVNPCRTVMARERLQSVPFEQYLVCTTYYTTHTTCGAVINPSTRCGQPVGTTYTRSRGYQKGAARQSCFFFFFFGDFIATYL